MRKKVCGRASRVDVVLVALILSATALISTVGAQSASPKVVLELFTSQGCSSCPPADALLESYVKRHDVVALSVPVDYWDRLGWKDTFAKRDYTARQQEYAAARGDGQIYTPQIVVSGMSHVVGSSRASIDSAIASAKTALRQTQVSLRARFEGDALIVEVGKAAQGANVSNARLLLAVVQDSGTVSIRRGENANRNVTYHNVVRSLKTIGAWTGEAASLRVAKSDYVADNGQSLTVLLQIGVGGPIVGAAQIRIASQS